MLHGDTEVSALEDWHSTLKCPSCILSSDKHLLLVSFYFFAVDVGSQDLVCLCCGNGEIEQGSLVPPKGHHRTHL